MENNLEQLLKILETEINNENFIDIAYNITEEISEMDNAFDAVSPILILMENNQNVDFGIPGPLVHFVERFYGKGYEEKLIKSLSRYPTKHTIWMLNRIINDKKGESKRNLINILKQISKKPNINKETLELVNHFIEIQNQ